MRSNDPEAEKGRQRREALERRRRLTPQERERAGGQILSALCGLAAYREAGRLLVYASIGDEVPTRELIGRALSEGKEVYCPRVEGKGIMSFYRIRKPEELTPGFRGIPEPPAEEARRYRPAVREAFRDVSPDRRGSGPDLIVMPGAAFDRSLGRLGYGGGFYDRFLQTLTEKTGTETEAGTPAGLRRIAVCFSCQLLERLCQEETDIRPELIVTEEEIIGPLPAHAAGKQDR